jgi:NADPH:quinone reductase-like Zn-dependent oxidoreductase
MRAIVQSSYGSPDVLSIREVPRPAPAPDEVLVEVRATAVNSGDVRLRAMNVPPGFGLIARLMFGVFGPRRPVLGVELSGVVVARGARVTRFSVGDSVFAMNGQRMGAHAEYCAISERGAIAKTPASLNFAESAALSFGGTTAMDFFRRAKLARGERVLVNGASGAVGVAAIQLAKHQGAHVTAVCSAANFELVRSLGADEVIDYRSEDFTKNGVRYDVIMDTVGTAPYARSRGSLAPRGRLLLVLSGLGAMFSSLWINATTDKRVIAGPITERGEDLEALAALVAQGAYRPVIDRRFEFEQIAEAHRYVDTGRKRGSVVVHVRGDATA